MQPHEAFSSFFVQEHFEYHMGTWKDLAPAGFVELSIDESTADVDDAV